MNQLRLVNTCEACPEQYDVYRDDKKVGYLRLRHGYFRAECRDVVVYSARPIGDGIFESYERDRYLNAACRAILDELARQEEVKGGEENLFFFGESDE